MRLQKSTRFLTTWLLLFLSVGFAFAEVCKGSKVPKVGLAQYDGQAILSLADQDAALQTHPPYGQPACPRLVLQREYILCYDPVNCVAR
ncbi:MAG TPA: hypothetical protein VN203_03325 [Candidatus Acidoferrum sp.]|nr:hypothetical protein [Candidatus Acidoferrum sp.]